MAIRIEREVYNLPRAVEPDVEIFAIGDIHGRSDLLAALLDMATGEPRLAARREVVFLGDLIDRGPDSLGAIEAAIETGDYLGAEATITLMGNHETMMRLALDPATPRRDALDALRNWIANGGKSLIAQLFGSKRPPTDPDSLLQATRAALPPGVERWLGELRPHARSGNVLFVHAGINPRFPLQSFLAAPWNVPLAALVEDRHWAWVRAPFLNFDPGPGGWDGFFVVHGHTPNDGRAHASHSDQIKRFRLNLDGGSAMTGVAKLAILRGGVAEVVTARATRPLGGRPRE